MNKTKYFVVTNCADDDMNVLGIIGANSPEELVQKLNEVGLDHFDDTDFLLGLTNAEWQFNKLTEFPVPFSIGHYYSGVFEVTLANIF